MCAARGVRLALLADCSCVQFLIGVAAYSGVEGWLLFGCLVRLIGCNLLPHP